MNAYIDLRLLACMLIDVYSRDKWIIIVFSALVISETYAGGFMLVISKLRGDYLKGIKTC